MDFLIFASNTYLCGSVFINQYLTRQFWIHSLHLSPLILLGFTGINLNLAITLLGQVLVLQGFSQKEKRRGRRKKERKKHLKQTPNIL